MSKVYHHNNWEKYEEADSNDTEADMPAHGADYEELLKATCMLCILHSRLIKL